MFCFLSTLYPLYILCLLFDLFVYKLYNFSMIVSPRVKGFICLTAHPVGAYKNVADQIEYVEKNLIGGQSVINQNDGKLEKNLSSKNLDSNLGDIKSSSDFSFGKFKSVLVIGGTTGYGLASAICASCSGAKVLVVGHSKQAANGRTASVGLYNTSALISIAKDKGKWVKMVSCDAFSDKAKDMVCEIVSEEMPPIDLVIYSIAAPKRKDPDTGHVYNSVLKPIDEAFESKNLNVDTGVISTIKIEPATDDEIEDTISVMGGEDWELWLHALYSERLLKKGVTTLSFGYIGPVLTHAIYRDGTIGEAKDDLKDVSVQLESLFEDVDLKSYISIQKALVTQASSAIPVVPLYLSLLYDIMKAKGTHEDCIMQITRLFQMLNSDIKTDDMGNIHLDDLEMDEEVQAEVARRFELVTTENLNEISDFKGYKAEFLKLFGFGRDDVDYGVDVDIMADEYNIVFGK